ncbi:MAG: DUF1858 domain-containing protein [Albidovulum sp.]
MAGPSIDDPELTLHALFQQWPDTIGVFMRHKMLCVGCSITSFHTVIDACNEYRLKEAAFRAELHEAVASKDQHTQKN